MRERIRDKERLEHILESIDRIQKNVADLDWEHIRENENKAYETGDSSIKQQAEERLQKLYN